MIRLLLLAACAFAAPRNTIAPPSLPATRLPIAAPQSFGRAIAAEAQAQAESGVPLERNEGVRTRLEELHTEGFTTLPAGAFVNEARERRIIDHVDRLFDGGRFRTYVGGDETSDKLHLYDKKQSADWMADAGAKRGKGGVKDLVGELTGALRAALPDEKFKLHRVELRVTEPGAKSEFPELHLDRKYLTITYVLGEGPTTPVYKTDFSGRTNIVEPGPREAAVLGALQREARTGLAAAVHSAPLRAVTERRRFLQIIYEAQDEAALPETLRRRVNSRIKRAAANVRSRFAPFLKESWGGDFDRAYGTPAPKKRGKPKASGPAGHAPILARRRLAPSFVHDGKSEVKIAYFDADSTLRVAPSGNRSANGPRDVMLLPWTAKKLAELSKQGYLIAIVSNQAGVPRHVSLEDSDGALNYLVELVRAEGGDVHYVDFAENRSGSRKPGLGMAVRLEKHIRKRFGAGVDMKGSFMVGDSAYKEGDIRPDGKPGSHFSNSDRKFAENLRVPFHEPTDFFGWRRHGIDVFEKPRQVEDFVREHGR